MRQPGAAQWLWAAGAGAVGGSVGGLAMSQARFRAAVGSREAMQHKPHKLRSHASLAGGEEASGVSTSVYSTPAGAEDAMKSIFGGCKPDQNLRRGGVERMGAASKQH